MPVNLSHLLNSAPVSPPRSLGNRARLEQQQQGPPPSRLTELLSPAASRQELSIISTGDHSPPLNKRFRLDEQPQHRYDPGHHAAAVGREEQEDYYDREKEAIIGLSLLKSTFHENFGPIPSEIEPPRYLELSAPVFNNRFEAPIREPVYQRPLPISSFSYNPNREMVCGIGKFESLRPFQLDPNNPLNPHIGFDLHHGLSDAIFREESVDEGLDGLLDCLSHAVESRKGSERPGFLRRLAETRFITWRGIMTKICSSVYETAQNEGWEMNVMLFNGTIYIEDHIESPRSSESGQIPCYYGYSYENLVTSLSGGFEQVNTNVQWVSVVKANLNGLRLILGGEVDCIRPEGFERIRNNLPPFLENDIDPRDFIEIKTSAAITTEKQRRTFYRFKLLKYWLQSFLLGTPMIHVGFRDQRGKLIRSENYRTTDIPQLVKNSSSFASNNPNYNNLSNTIKWSGSLCLDNGSSILRFISDSLENNQRSKFYENKFKEFINERNSEQGTNNPFNRVEEEEFFEIFKKWPVFRIKLIPHNPNNNNTQNQYPINNNMRFNNRPNDKDKGKVEIRELNFEEEVLRGSVQSNKQKISRKIVVKKVVESKDDSYGGERGREFKDEDDYKEGDGEGVIKSFYYEDRNVRRIGFLPLSWILKNY